MGEYIVEISTVAKNDLRKFIKAGKKNEITKIETLLKELRNNPRSGSGHPEQLKHLKDNREFWSRRINQKDRLVYEIIEFQEKKIIVIQLLGHYSDR
jgi:toxin YoeB